MTVLRALLLTDVVMPRLGGADLVASLQKPRPNLPVVFMSGYTDGAISQQGILGEDILLIEKPFTGDRLVRLTVSAMTVCAISALLVPVVPAKESRLFEECSE